MGTVIIKIINISIVPYTIENIFTYFPLISFDPHVTSLWDNLIIISIL